MRAATSIALVLLILVVMSSALPLSSSSLGVEGGVSSLVSRSSRPFSSDVVNGRFIVLGEGKPLQELLVLIEGFNGRVVGEFKLVKGLVVEGSQGLAEVIRGRGFKVYPDRVVYLLEPIVLPVRSDVEPMVNVSIISIGASGLHILGVNGSGVKVAVVDTGIENMHPWLIRGNTSVVAWEVDATGTGVIDYCGKRIGDYWGGVHGTHIAGIIASQHPEYRGVAPGVELYDVIVIPEMIGDLYTGCYSTTASYVMKGVELALLGPDGEPGTGDEADVISLSLGYILPPEIQYSIVAGIIEDPLIELLEKAVGMGKVVVVAAGNAYGLNMVNALCLAEGVICVGASSHMGTVDPGDDMIAWFSSKGPGPLGLLLPHVVAPGVFIYSSIPSDLAILYYLEEPADYLSGTSMSTPFVSGSAAIIVGYLRSKGVKVTPLDVMARIVQTAVDVKPQAAEAFWLLPDWYKELLKQYIPTPPVNTPVDQGGGLINVYQATLAELRLSIQGKPLGYLISSSGSVGFEVSIENVANTTLTIATSRGLVKLWNVYTFEDVSNAISLEDKSFELKPGSNASIKVNVNNLKPGVYGGYIGFRVLKSGVLYRIPVLIVVPVSMGGGELRVLQTLKLSTGTRDIWDIVTLYIHVDKPLLEPLSLSTLSSPGAPGMVSLTLTTPSGYYTSFTNSIGYVLLEPGVYTLSAWILFAFEWPINVDFTLSVGAPTLTEGISRALEELQQLSSRVALIESTLDMVSKTLESLREELFRESQLLRSRIDTLNTTLLSLERVLDNLGAQLQDARTTLDKLSLTLSNVNKTLSDSIARESRRISDLELRLQQTRGELESVRESLNTKTEELSRRATSIEEAHSTTRTIAIISTLIGLTALAASAYSILRRR